MMVKCWLSDSEKIIYDLIHFENVSICYDLSKDVCVEFEIDRSVKGSTKDWIGIFQAGWRAFESFLTFEWGIGFPVTNSSRRRKIIIPSKFIRDPKPDTHYQFVYISQNLEILGVSQFFQFINAKKANETTDLNLSLPMSSVTSSSTYKEKELCPKTDAQPVSLSKIQESRQNNGHYLPTCKVYSPKWDNLCTTCYHCKSIVEMKNSQNNLIQKVREYEDLNAKLRGSLSRLDHLLLPWKEVEERKSFDDYIKEVSGAIDRAIQKSVFGEMENKGDSNSKNLKQEMLLFDLDVDKKELYLKALLGHQELKIQNLITLIKKLDEQNNVSGSPGSHSSDSDEPLQDVVKLVKTEEKVIAEVYELKISD